MKAKGMTMKAAGAMGGLLLMVAVAGVGCDARWHLVGESGSVLPPGGTGGVGPMSAGPSSPAGSGGAGGQGPSPMPEPRSIGTSAPDAVTRMAWFLWQSPPDAALLASATPRLLATSEDVRQLGLRMQQDARARAGVTAFYRWWLELDQMATVYKDPARFPTFSAALGSDMVAETETFATSVTLDMNGTLTQLLTAPFTYVNESLAAVYGLSGVSGPALRMVMLPPDKRAGLFTQPSFLTLRANPGSGSPVARGKFINDRLLCNPVPPPPANVPEIPPAPPGTTQRQQLEAVTSSPCASACHFRLDGIGFAFENYDAIGQYRTLDNGLPIDASVHLDWLNIPAVRGAVELTGALAHHPAVETCLSRTWLQYALGRRLTDADEPSVSEAHSFFAASGFNLQALIAAVMQTDAFLSSPPVCTPGLDQTCNDDPKRSSLAGQCTAAARCVCKDGQPNPDTGLCY